MKILRKGQSQFKLTMRAQSKGRMIGFKVTHLIGIAKKSHNNKSLEGSEGRVKSIRLVRKL